MNTIDDFVNRRCQDAKCRLRRLDSEFVDKVESTVRLQSVGLSTPWVPDVGDAPRRRLPKQWHRLLESCLELTMEASRLKVSAQSLGANAYLEMDPVDVGKRADYHLPSWFTHAVTLSERAKDVIRQTAKTYVGDGKTIKALSRRYEKQVEQEFTRIRTLRNQFVHGGARPLASPITKGDFWESNVAAGMTPQMFLGEIRYSLECDRLRAGKYGMFVAETTSLCDSLGSILGSLQGDLPPVDSR